MAQQVKASHEVATSPVVLSDPGPLGLSGFALTTFVLSVINAGFLDPGKYVTIVLGLAIFYGGITQLLAGMWEFHHGNTFGGVAFSSYGAFWLSYAAVFIPGLGVTVGSLTNPHPALGLYLLGWAIVTAMLMLGSFHTNGALAAVFVALFLTFVCLTIGELARSTFFVHLGGWIGIITAAVAWYTALAGILRSLAGGRHVLPVFPLA
jgi:succinate-acetate transporter protein